MTGDIKNNNSIHIRDYGYNGRENQPCNIVSFKFGNFAQQVNIYGCTIKEH